MINVPFSSIDKSAIEGLVLDEGREGRTLDNKEGLPTSGRDDRKEFLADVTAFANGAGATSFTASLSGGRTIGRPVSRKR